MNRFCLRPLLAVLVFLAGFPLSLQANEIDFEAALKVHESGDAERAIDMWNRMLRQDPGNSVVNYNLANAHDVAGQKGEAVYYYYRSLFLDPSLEEARQNLGLIQPEANQQNVNSTSYIFSKLFIQSSSMIWFGLFQMLVLVTLIALILYGRRISRLNDRMPVYLVLAGLFFVTILGALTIEAHRDWRKLGIDAIVMEETVARQDAGDKYFKAMDLETGTAVRLAESPEDGWVKIQILNGTSGYVKVDSIRPL